mmetsp:Transcript_27284/g.78384  ORF Transcript_27284/g.78384 Transcript_27284/m.78384 type:complete len:230 (-) Transcript_27284:81-770(-)
MLQLVQSLVSLLGRHVCVPEVHDGLVRLPIDVFQGVGPRAHAHGGVVVEDPVVAVEVLRPVGRERSLEGLHGNPEQVVVRHGVDAEVPSVGDELWARGLEALPLLVLGLADEVVDREPRLRTGWHAGAAPAIAPIAALAALTGFTALAAITAIRGSTIRLLGLLLGLFGLALLGALLRRRGGAAACDALGFGAAAPLALGAALRLFLVVLAAVQLPEPEEDHVGAALNS